MGYVITDLGFISPNGSLRMGNYALVFSPFPYSWSIQFALEEVICSFGQT